MNKNSLTRTITKLKKDNFEIEEIKKSLNLLDKIFVNYPNNYSKHLNTFILNTLNMKIGDEKIGDILIKESFANNQPLSYSLILFDLDRTIKGEKISSLVWFEPSLTRCLGMACKSPKTLKLAIPTSYLSSSSNDNLIIKQNLDIMLTLRHEYCHFVQFSKEETHNSSKLEKLYYDFSDFANHVPCVNDLFHDYFPDELEANVLARINLIKLFNEEYRDILQSEDIINYLFNDLFQIIDKQNINNFYKYIFDYEKVLNSNLSLSLYKIMDYSLNLLLSDDILCDYHYDIYRMLKIYQSISNIFPEEIPLKFPRNLNLMKLKSLNINFNYDNVFGNSETKKKILESRKGRELLGKLGCDTENNIEEHEAYLTFLGYDKDKIYHSFYLKNKDDCDFYYFVDCVNNIKKKPKIKTKRYRRVKTNT